MMSPRLAVAIVLAAVACSRSQPERAPDAPTQPVHVAPQREAQPSTAAGIELSRPSVERLIAIGDLHGDLAATRRALRLAGAIGDDDHWAGGTLTVVQTGDVLDRGDDDRKIFDWLEQLRSEAKAAGGELILLSGNHELMNVAQDFRYVTPGAFAGFDDLGGRPMAFRSGGVYALRVAMRPFVAQVGDTVFVHGGVLPEHVEYGLARMAGELRAWLAGQAPVPTLLTDDQSPVWTRAYSSEPPDCERLTRALAMLRATRMVVGHTPQQSGITAACDGAVWRIDTGMSHFYGGPLEVLELRGERVTPLRE